MLPRSLLGRAFERRRGGGAGRSRLFARALELLCALLSAAELDALGALHVGMRPLYLKSGHMLIRLQLQCWSMNRSCSSVALRPLYLVACLPFATSLSRITFVIPKYTSSKMEMSGCLQ